MQRGLIRAIQKKCWEYSGIRTLILLSYDMQLDFSQRKCNSILNSQDILGGCTPKVLTRRMVLAQVNKFYDLLGLISPFIVRAKIMMRRLWSVEPKLGWDNPLPDDLMQKWVKYFKEVPNLGKIEFPRAVKPNEAIGAPDLVIFSDGSMEAYGAVAYVRWELENGSFETHLFLCV